jgi:hypothetical protein
VCSVRSAQRGYPEDNGDFVVASQVGSIPTALTQSKKQLKSDESAYHLLADGPR